MKKVSMFCLDAIQRVRAKFCAVTFALSDSDRVMSICHVPHCVVLILSRGYTGNFRTVHKDINEML